MTSSPDDAPILADRHLVRTNGGAMIHRDSCNYVAGRNGSKAVPWLWADKAPLEMVRRAVIQFGYRSCKVCMPLPDGRGQRFQDAINRVRDAPKGAQCPYA